MARLCMIVIGPSRGGFSAPRCHTAEVGTVAEALAASDEAAAGAGDSANGGDRPGGVAFLNGADVRLNALADRAVSPGDVLTVVHPSTDT